jgi:hypothetical protein
MATYKGIGFDGTSGKIRTATSSDSVQFNAEIDAQDGILATNGVQTDTLTTTGDASVGGNLTVDGDIISRGQVNLVVQDPMIDLGIGNTTTTAQAGGYSLTMNRNSGFTAETVTACTSGDAGVPSAPTLTVSGTSNFSAGDVLVLSGSSAGENNGIFIVANASGSTVTLEGVGGTAISGNTPFAQNQVTTTTGDNGTAIKVDLYVQAVADGVNFNDAGGSPYTKGTLLEVYQANATKSDFTANGSYSMVGASASSLSLQDVYGNGNSITTSGNAIDFNLASGNFTIDQGNMVLGGTNATNFTMDGGSFSAGATTGLSVFGVVTNGNSGGDIVLSESGASGSIQIEVNSGTVLEAKSGALDLNTDIDFGKATGSVQTLKRLSVANGDDLKIALTGANDASLILESAGTGNDAIKLDATAGGFDIAGELDSKILVTTGALEVGTFTSGDLTMSTTTAGAIIVDSAENIDMNATGGVTVDGTAISIDGTALSNFSVTGANAVLSTITSGNVQITSAGTIDLSAGGTQIAQVIDFGGGATGFKMESGSKLVADTTGGFQFGTSATVIVDDIKDEDNMVSDSATALATQQSIKAYVDNSIPVVDQSLNFQGDSGSGTINLATQTLDIAGGSNITTTASGQTNTVALDSDITLTSVTATTLATTNLKANDGTASVTIADTTGDFTVSSSLALASGTPVSSILDEDNMASDSNTALATQQSIKAYVDSTVEAYQGFTVLGDGSSGALASGDVVAINGSGQAIQANASASSTANVIGICVLNDSGTIYIQQVGNNTGLTGLTAGTKYYLATGAGGNLTATAPSGSGNVVFQVGFARSSTELVVAPNFIMEIG